MLDLAHLHITHLHTHTRTHMDTLSRWLRAGPSTENRKHIIAMWACSGLGDIIGHVSGVDSWERRLTSKWTIESMRARWLGGRNRTTTTHSCTCLFRSTDWTWYISLLCSINADQEIGHFNFKYLLLGNTGHIAHCMLWSSCLFFPLSLYETKHGYSSMECRPQE